MVDIKIVKKDGTQVPYDSQKIVTAVGKSAARVMVKLTDEEISEIISKVESYINSCQCETITIAVMHNIVEAALERINFSVAKSYKEYRNYKIDFVNMLDEVYNKAQAIMYLGDKENSNTDSALVTTKRSLIYNELNKELYNKFFLTVEERQACRDGYIYIHDKSARRDTMNCCLFNAKNVMLGGFEMGNMWYNEPKTIDAACDVLGDVIMMSASMQYGGWSTRVDDLLAYYCEKSYKFYQEEFFSIIGKAVPEELFKSDCTMKDEAEKYAYAKTVRDLEQGLQGLEYKLNSVASSRGDYPSK